MRLWRCGTRRRTCAREQYKQSKQNVEYVCYSVIPHSACTYRVYTLSRLAIRKGEKKHLITVTDDCNLSESRGSTQGRSLSPHGLKRGQPGRTRRSAPTRILLGRAPVFGLALGPDFGFDPDIFRGDWGARHPAARCKRQQHGRNENSKKNRVRKMGHHHQAFLARRASQAFTCRVTCFRAVPPV